MDRTTPKGANVSNTCFSSMWRGNQSNFKRTSRVSGSNTNHLWPFTRNSPRDATFDFAEELAQVSIQTWLIWNWPSPTTSLSLMTYWKALRKSRARYERAARSSWRNTEFRTRRPDSRREEWYGRRSYYCWPNPKQYLGRMPMKCSWRALETWPFGTASSFSKSQRQVRSNKFIATWFLSIFVHNWVVQWPNTVMPKCTAPYAREFKIIFASQDGNDIYLTLLLWLAYWKQT